MSRAVANRASMSRVLTASALVLAAELALGGCEGGAPVEELELSGRVTVFNEGSPDGGEPVEGATVVFTSDTLLSAETSTNGAGRYRLLVLSDTRFGEVRASAAGFRDATATVFFDRSPRRVDLAMPRE